MLRFLYTVFDLFAGVLAIASPVAIFHWLLKVTKVTAAEPVIQVFNPVFEPLNGLLTMFVHAPVLTFNGNTIPTTQGLVACLMTAGFFLFNIGSEYLKVTEQRADVEQQAKIQRRRLQQLKKEQKHHQQKISSSRNIYAFIQYDFKLCPQGAAQFETLYSRNGGKLLESTQTGLALEFETLERAFKYSLEATQAVASYYATLRPMDPQPSYQVAIEAVDVQLSKPDAIRDVRKLVSYTAINQVLFGPDVHTIMAEQALQQRFHYQSVGMYVIDGRQRELYRLFYERQ